MIEFKRARRDETLVAFRRIWESRGGQFRVCESRSKFGLPTCYYALRLVVQRDGFVSWSIVSRHRIKSAAAKACEKSQKEKR